MPNYLTVDGRSQVPPVSLEREVRRVQLAKAPSTPTNLRSSASLQAFGKRIIPIRASDRELKAIREKRLWSRLRRSGRWQYHGRRAVYPDNAKNRSALLSTTGQGVWAYRLLAMPSTVLSLPRRDSGARYVQRIPSSSAMQRRLLFPMSIIPPRIAVSRRVSQVGDCKWVSTPLEMSSRSFGQIFTAICRRDTRATWRNSSRKHPSNPRNLDSTLAGFCRRSASKGRFKQSKFE